MEAGSIQSQVIAICKIISFFILNLITYRFYRCCISY